MDLFLMGLIVGCAPSEKDPIRVDIGCNAESDAATIVFHTEPVGAEYKYGTFCCRDASGNLWQSNGECD